MVLNVKQKRGEKYKKKTETKLRTNTCASITESFNQNTIQLTNKPFKLVSLVVPYRMGKHAIFLKHDNGGLQ